MGWSGFGRFGGGEGDLDPITPAYTSCSVMSFLWTCTKNFASTVHTQEEKINGDVLLLLDPPLHQPSHPASPLPNTISPHIVPVLTSPTPFCRLATLPSLVGSGHSCNACHFCPSTCLQKALYGYLSSHVTNRTYLTLVASAHRIGLLNKFLKFYSSENLRDI